MSHSPSLPSHLPSWPDRSVMAGLDPVIRDQAPTLELPVDPNTSNSVRDFQ
jgi:hypothetical protein